MSLHKEEKQKTIREFAQTEQDTGSMHVQIALLTQRIRELTEHCKKHAKDFSSMRGLVKMVCRRRRYLKYVEDTSKAQYTELIQRLGLRK